MNFLETLRQRADGWFNVITGLGTARDKSQATAFGACIYRLPDQVLAAMFQTEDLSAKIVDVYPQEALSQGYEHCPPDGDEAGQTDLETAMAEYEKSLCVLPLLTDGAIWGRLFGGALLMVQTDRDTVESVAEPLGEFEAVTAIRVIDRRYADPTPWAVDDAGEITSYNIYPDGKRSGEPLMRVHVSRLVRLPGARTEWETSRSINRWDLSVLQRPFQALASDGAVWKSIEVLVQEASTGVFKVSNLFAMVAQGNKADLLDRFRILGLNKSVSRDILLDKEKEDYTRIPVQFAGLPDLAQFSIKRVAAAAEMPVTVLLGEAPAGMNATGDSDLRWWLKRVDAYRRLVLEPCLVRLLKIIYQASSAPKLPLGKDGLPVVVIKWPNLWTPTEAERAEIYSKVATADVALIGAQVLLPEEVALARFGADGYSIETTIDRDLREEALASDNPADVEGEDPNAPPAEPGATAPVDPNAEPAKTAMNGAQVSSLIEVVTAAADGTIPRQSAQAILETAFQLSPADAARMLGPEDFEPTKPPAPPSPFGGGPPKPPFPPKADEPPKPEPPAGE